MVFPNCLKCRLNWHFKKSVQFVCLNGKNRMRNLKCQGKQAINTVKARGSKLCCTEGSAPQAKSTSSGLRL